VASDLGPSNGGKKRRPWKVTFLFLIFLMAAIGVLFAVIFQPELFTSQAEPLDASGTESTVTDQGPASSEPNSSTEGGDDPATPAEDVALDPISMHAEFAELDAAAEQHLSSFFQIWLEPGQEGEVSPLATPQLVDGVFDITFNFVEMTVSGSFDLDYERDAGETGVCEGSPEEFSGRASGSFADLPIIEAITSEAPPSDWGLPPEDWWPGDEGNWYIGGSFPVSLEMSGVIVMACFESVDGTTSYSETPFSESATVTAWVNSGIDVWRDQGPEHTTEAYLDLNATTNEPRDSNPFWDFSTTWSHIAERPVPDPFE
jgi:hypothetical protein